MQHTCVTYIEKFTNNNDFPHVNGTLCLDFLRDPGFPATYDYCYRGPVSKQQMVFGTSTLNKATEVTVKKA